MRGSSDIVHALNGYRYLLICAARISGLATFVGRMPDLDAIGFDYLRKSNW
jgi:hypothetical protein